jgi:hypothetical protein
MLDAHQANAALDVVEHQMSEPPRSRANLGSRVAMLFEKALSISFEVQDAPVDANMRYTSLSAKFAQESDREANNGSKLRFCECVGSSFGTKHKRLLNFLGCKQNLLRVPFRKSKSVGSSQRFRRLFSLARVV